MEDLIGAGALLAELPGALSPEAEHAVAAFRRFHGRLHETLSRCASGRELVERGYAADIDLASAYDCSLAAPRLVLDRYVDDRASESSAGPSPAA